MGKVEIDHTGSGSGITLSSDGTSLLLDGTAIGGGGGGDPDLYRDNAVSATTPTASGDNAVAIGNGSSATSQDAYAIGRDATASNFYAMAFGRDSIASGSQAFAGPRSTASGTQSVCLGTLSTASGGTTAVLGPQASATVTDGLALGRYATSAGTAAAAVGKSYASGTDSFAAVIDNNTSSYGSTGSNSIAMGKLAKASGAYSTAIGESTQAQGNNSVCLGYYSQSQGQGTMVMGYDAQSTAVHCTSIGTNTRNAIDGTFKFSGGKHSAAGDAQVGIYPVLCETTDATATTFVTYHSNTITPQTDNQIVLPNNSAYAFSGTIVARQKASEGTACAAWKIEGLIRREGSAGTTVLVNSAKTVLDNTPSWDVTLSADTTNGCLKIQGTGAASTNIRWSSTITTSELTYA